MRSGEFSSIVLICSLLIQCSSPPKAVLQAAMPEDQSALAPEKTVLPQGEWVCIYWNYEGRSSEVGFEAGSDPWLRPIFSGQVWGWKPDPKTPMKPFARIVPGDAAGGSIVIEAVGTKESLQGIYDIRGGLFRICFSTDKPGVGPPTDFEILPFDKEVTLTYRRVDAPEDERRQSEIRCLCDSIDADAVASQKFSRLNMEVAAGRITVPHFEIGAARSDSVLLGLLRDSLGIAREKIAADNNTLVEMALFHLNRALAAEPRRDRLHGEQRAEARERMRRRKEAKEGRSRPDKP